VDIRFELLPAPEAQKEIEIGEEEASRDHAAASIADRRRASLEMAAPRGRNRGTGVQRQDSDTCRCCIVCAIAWSHAAPALSISSAPCS
jgi:hypothetical protein